MTVYYNESDPKAAAWLRELMFEDHIPWGEVDERSIEDIRPAELAGYTQCHFFAGIGGWSYALRLAGWPSDRPVWTGSCPCQPFSAAGKGAGFADERHLWPSWHWLIQQRRPDIVFGEQVATALQWWDLVSADLEVEGYTTGAAIIGAHSVGAPHIRQRLYWMAESHSGERHGFADGQGRIGDGTARGWIEGDSQFERRSENGRMADAAGERRAGQHTLLRQEDDGRQPAANILEAARGGEARVMAGADDTGPQGWRERRHGADQRSTWAYSLVDCRDGKRRPVEPGTFPLAHGVPARVGRLRGYGNAIVPQVAAAFIEAYLES